ncbi:hypothetical protein, partial [Neobacillus niacini]|uniref:hypothetical protein n=1 Tax=Neobacillus niacini TaxID=86668 RepID=UPI0037C601B6|nr:hypothetical protein [Neobacillus niacini]
RRLLREYGTGETPQARNALRRLPEPPAESEAPGTEINRPPSRVNFNKIGHSISIKIKNCREIYPFSTI